MGKYTDEILGKIKNGTSNEDSINFIDEDAARAEIRAAINQQYASLNQFANECAIQPSHLSEFFNNRKKLGRDKLLTVLINLHYDFDTMQSMLQRLHVPILYVRNKRDYVIAVAIQEGKTLDDIEDILQTKNMELLMPTFGKK